MQKVSEKDLFMVSVGSQKTPDDTGHRMVRGKTELGAFVREALGSISGDSKAKMAKLIEESHEHNMATFRGVNSLEIYNENCTRKVSVYLISSSVGL